MKRSTFYPDGRGWTLHDCREFDERWAQVSVGNVDMEGADAQADPILQMTGESCPWRVAKILHYDGRNYYSTLYTLYNINSMAKPRLETIP